MTPFHERLRQEILESQKERGELARQKLTFVMTALGVGALSTDSFSGSNLLYLAPFIAFVFDLYIAGQDFNVKRIGGFLGSGLSGTSNPEQLWEDFVRRNRDPFARIANPLLSLLVLLASAVGIWASQGVSPLYLGWLVVNALLTAGLWYSSHLRNQRVAALK